MPLMFYKQSKSKKNWDGAARVQFMKKVGWLLGDGKGNFFYSYRNALAFRIIRN